MTLYSGAQIFLFIKFFHVHNFTLRLAQYLKIMKKKKQQNINIVIA